jgi:hypothetical protein
LLSLVLAGCHFGVDGVDASVDPGDLAAPDLQSPDDGPPDLTAEDLATDDGGGTPVDGLVPNDLTFPADGSGGVLSGSIVASPATLVDLTVAGLGDWAHWGMVNATSFDHKLTGGSQISNFTNLLGGPVTQHGGYPIPFTWSDGTPDTTAMPAGGTTTGVYLYGTGQGFRITAPADTTDRTLTLYVGGQQSTCTVTAHLSDGSAADYVASAKDQGKLFTVTITLAYRAASAGQTLTVDWAVTSNTGFAHVQSATLQ